MLRGKRKSTKSNTETAIKTAAASPVSRKHSMTTSQKILFSGFIANHREQLTGKTVQEVQRLAVQELGVLPSVYIARQVCEAIGVSLAAVEKTASQVSSEDFRKLLYAVSGLTTVVSRLYQDSGLEDDHTRTAIHAAASHLETLRKQYLT